MVIELTLSNLDEGLKRILYYKNQFINRANLFLQMLCNTGVQIARVKVIEYDAVDTLQLATNIDYRVVVTGKEAVIITTTGYAAFVEFGTGLNGEQHPHPNQGTWKYDMNHHGEDGWVYYDERHDKFVWTKGRESRPFFYETAQELGSRTRQLAREVFKT